MTAPGRYSKVSRRVWTDERCRALSSAPPNAQTLWFRLLTGPELTNIPGLFPAWEAGLAQALGWPLEGFRKAFGEVSSKGMAKADWIAGLVWVPKAIAHNRPESPNVVKSWWAAWADLPECKLKAEAHCSLRAFVEGMGEAFAKAFEEACGKASGKPCPNQEQEQEQRESSQAPAPLTLTGETPAKKATGKKPPKPSPEIPGHQDVIACFVEEYEKCRSEKPIVDGKTGKAAKLLLEKTKSSDASCATIRRAFASSNFVRTEKPDLMFIATNVNDFRGTAPAKTNGRHPPVQPSVP
jgi:hypothetical protein